jgi:hypothetical protein
MERQQGSDSSQFSGPRNQPRFYSNVSSQSQTPERDNAPSNDSQATELELTQSTQLSNPQSLVARYTSQPTEPPSRVQSAQPLVDSPMNHPQVSNIISDARVTTTTTYVRSGNDLPRPMLPSHWFNYSERRSTSWPWDTTTCMISLSAWVRCYQTPSGRSSAEIARTLPV